MPDLDKPITPKIPPPKATNNTDTDSPNRFDKKEANTSTTGFPPLAVTRIRGALRLNAIAIYFIYIAIVMFLILGTLASLKINHDSRLMYQLFHYLPYALVGITIPVILYNAFVLFRYRLSQNSMLLMCLSVGFGLLIANFLMDEGSLLWLGLSAWIGMAFLFRANFKRFFSYFDESKSLNEKKLD